MNRFAKTIDKLKGKTFKWTETPLFTKKIHVHKDGCETWVDCCCMAVTASGKRCTKPYCADGGNLFCHIHARQATKKPVPTIFGPSRLTEDINRRFRKSRSSSQSSQSSQSSRSSQSRQSSQSSQSSRSSRSSGSFHGRA